MRTASGAGVDGASTRAISTTETEKTSTIITGRKRRRPSWGCTTKYQLVRGPYPSERPPSSRRRASIWLAADNPIKIRNGTSLATNPATSIQPVSSGTRFRLGGRSQPVAHGERSRISQPLGCSRNKKPTAMVICGTESSGEIKRVRNAPPPVPTRTASRPIANK